MEENIRGYIYFLLCCRHLGDTYYADASGDARTYGVVYVVQPLTRSLDGAYAGENTMEAYRAHASLSLFSSRIGGGTSLLKRGCAMHCASRRLRGVSEACKRGGKWAESGLRSFEPHRCACEFHLIRNLYLRLH